jgi:predicted RND superfamily exporter protein
VQASNKQDLAESKAPFLERFLFGNRKAILVFFVIATIFLGFQASKLRMSASFDKMIPTYHTYIANYLERKDELPGLGNVVWVAVENSDGTIYDAEYLEVLQQVTDEVFFIPGVMRSSVKSLWTPHTRWTEVTEEGFDGGPVVPDWYDGTPDAMAQLKVNVLRSGEVGKLVANNFRSSMVMAPLMDLDPETGEKLDYQLFSSRIEELVRDKYSNKKIKIHVTGFAKVVGDLIDGATQVGIFFALTVLIASVLLYLYTRCIRATMMPVVCALVAVVWQAGMLYTLGFGLDPYSMLVPFLVFAIGVSHGVQMINGMKHQAMQGHDKNKAARYTFRILYIPALCALVTDGIGFAILYVIRIGVLQDMAVGAAIRFPVLILSMLVALPLLMSFIGISRLSVEQQRDEEEEHKHPLWHTLAGITHKRVAISILVVVGVLAVLGFNYRSGLQIGDLDKGAPELRPDSRYNKDVAFVNENFSSSSDVFVVMVETPDNEISRYDALVAMDKLQWELEGLEGVQNTNSLSDYVKIILSGYNEGNIKWMALNRNQIVTDNAAIRAPHGTNNESASLAPLMVYLTDHKAATLDRVVKTVETFAAENNTENLEFLMGAGLAGIEAATNIEIEKAQNLMLVLVYGVVGFLVFITFRCWRATICIMIPLALTSLLCEVLMTYLGIGVKVATLPVISVGVGIGVDYGVYIYSRLIGYLEEGESLLDAYYHTLKTTGKAVAFTGITLAAGVCTWSFSSIKFQADMGILLTFMFLWNMIGALCLLPALARFLVVPKYKLPKDDASDKELNEENSTKMQIRKA